MKKLLFLTLTIGSLISCKDDKKEDIVEDGNYTWNYEGYYRRTSNYVLGNGDSLWYVSNDDTAFYNKFYINGKDFSNTLQRISQSGDSSIIKESFLLDKEGAFRETSGGGSSYYSLSIKATNDSLFVSETKNSGMANTFSTFIRAKRTN